jgi:hypothetical protein
MEGTIGFEKEVQDMDISVIGASGDVGTETVNQLLAGRVLTPSERLQMVGRVEGKSSSRLYGLQSDLSDAYAEVTPELEVVLTPEKIRGDIVILAAGAPVTAPNQTRNELAQLNLPVFRRYAQAIAAHGHGRELVLVVSNPVELAVEVFSQYLGRHRVIGVGGYSDSAPLLRSLAVSWVASPRLMMRLPPSPPSSRPGSCLPHWSGSTALASLRWSSLPAPAIRRPLTRSCSSTSMALPSRSINEHL